mgnify:CR=1 FL=1
MNTHEKTYPWLAELNADQRRAVTHGEGPLLIVAGAGSGKTRTLACRAAYLISEGVDPERILLLTFTRRAAVEMSRRAAETVQKGPGTGIRGKIWGGTFHGTANRLLRIYARAAGLNPGFTVMDKADSEDMISVVRHELGLHAKKKRFPRKHTCMSIYSRTVNGRQSLAEVLERHFPWCDMWEKELKEIFRQYVLKKQGQNVLDYDDLLLYWAQLLKDRSLASETGGRFDHILVDEYQDTNSIQADILEGMRIDNRNITVVGDDAQSIYSFRAATVRNILDFPDRFPGTRVVTLERNYRSVEPVLETTNRVISSAEERYTKDLVSVRGPGESPRLVTCRDEAGQDDYVAGKILEHYEQGIPLRNQAVLFRASHHSDSLEIELGRRNIPYHKYGGLRFLESAHVKDMVSFLRIVENPLDETAWFRILQLFDGVGPATAARAVAWITGKQSGSSASAIAGFDCPAASRTSFSSLAVLVDDLSSGSLSPSAEVERIRNFYGPFLKKLYDNSAVRSKDLENLEQIASGYRSRRSFLTDLQLDPPNSTGDLAGPPVKDEDWAALSTIHSAKGCEWDVVFVIHASDGCLPSDMAAETKEELEEELRLLYVAMTRARDFLYVVWPQRYYHNWAKHTDRHTYAQLSRFITDEVRESMEETSASGPITEDEESAAAGRLDIAGRMVSMWD